MSHPQIENRTELARNLFEVVRLLESHELGVRVAREHGLRLSWLQVRALWFLAPRSSTNQRQLAALLGATAPTTSKLCARLSELGYLIAVVGQDPRERLIELTTAGRAAAQSVYQGGDDLIETAVAGWTESQRAAFADALAFLYEGLTQGSTKRCSRVG